jgi:hypothetical protein
MVFTLPSSLQSGINRSFCHTRVCLKLFVEVENDSSVYYFRTEFIETSTKSPGELFQDTKKYERRELHQGGIKRNPFGYTLYSVDYNGLYDQHFDE